ncbi:MAG: tape measure protein [Burkholderiaceae bacterium]|jgi:tape measure domain-containing protein|nr:tape measure protein [Burkholderiaceae bacterium]
MATNGHDVELNVKAKATAEGFDTLADELRAITAESDELKAAQARANQEFTQAKAAHQQSRDALRELVLTTDQAGRRTQEYKTRLAALRIAEFEAGKTARQRKAALDESTTAATKASRAQADLARRLDETKKASAGATAGAGMLGRAFAAVAAALSVREFTRATTTLESLRRTLTQVTGSADEAAQQIDFLRNVADRAGVAFDDVAGSYGKFAASAKTAGIEMSIVNQTFEAVIRSAGQLGLGSQQAQRALDALGQMASKGVVSMEELRQQLGDSLPGALSIAAKAFGVVDQKFIAMVESGQVLSRDFLRVIGPEMVAAFAGGEKAVTGLAASWARLKNAVSEGMQAVGNAGATTVLTKSVDALAATARAATDRVAGVGAVVDDVKRAATEASGPLDFLANLFPALGQRSADSTARLLGVADAADLAGEAASQNASMAQVAAQAADDVAAAKQREADAIAAGIRAWASASSAYAESTKEAAAATQTSAKLAEARDIEGKAAERLARLSGDETAAREASLAAARGNVVALESVAAARQREVDLLTAQHAAMSAAAQAIGAEDSARTAALARLQQTIDAKTAEAAKSAELVRAAQAEADAREVAAAAAQDNANALGELRAAYVRAQRAADEMAQQVAAGTATQEQANEAARDAAKAHALLVDAMNDTAAAADRKIAALQRDASITEASLRLEQQRARTAEMVAERLGNEYEATQAKIRQKEIEIQIVGAAIDASLAEAKAVEAAAEADRAALEASGTLTEAKRAEIDARLANARAKRIEAEAGRESIAQIENEIESIRSLNREKKKTQEIDREAARSSNDSGTFGAGVDTDQLARGAGLRGEQVARFREVYADALADSMKELESQNTKGDNRQALEAWTGAQWQAVQRAADLARATPRDAAPDRTSAPASGQRVEIVINGRPTPVNVASEGDAQALTNVLQQLAEASTRAS